ncbi:MAG: FadR/GntR family transcriptional regulator [Bacillus sp. (in: firmicutes)]
MKGEIPIIEKVSSKKVSEHVSEQLEGLILEGVYKPGEKLPSARELCGLFGAGRSAIRDALTVLKGKGIIEIKQGEGAYVCAFDSSRLLNPVLMPVRKKDLTELFQVRKLLEPGMAEMAAASRSEDQVQKLKKTLSIPGWQADYEFHHLIAQAAGNDIVLELLQFISQALKRSMENLYRSIADHPEALDEINKQHLAIFELISSKNGKEAKYMMEVHLQLVEDLFCKYVLRE